MLLKINPRLIPTVFLKRNNAEHERKKNQHKLRIQWEEERCKRESAKTELEKEYRKRVGNEIFGNRNDLGNYNIGGLLLTRTTSYLHVNTLLATSVTLQKGVK